MLYNIIFSAVIQEAAHFLTVKSAERHESHEDFVVFSVKYHILFFGKLNLKVILLCFPA